MKILKEDQISLVSGGMNWDVNRMSGNFIDLRGAPYPGYIDAAGMRRPSVKPSSTMYPSGINIDPVGRFIGDA